MRATLCQFSDRKKLRAFSQTRKHEGDETLIHTTQSALWQPCRPPAALLFCSWWYLFPRLQLALGLVCLFCQMEEQLKELFGLADKEPISDEALNGARCVYLPGACGTNNCTFWQALDEVGWLGHDQV